MKKGLTLIFIALCLTLCCVFAGCQRPNAPEAEGSLNFKLKGDNTYEVVGIGSYNSAVLEIPSTYNDLPVTSIGEEAFYQNNKLAIVTIPVGINSIGEEAFSECDALISITIPNSVNSIATNAFSYSNKIVEVYNFSDIVVTNQDEYENESVYCSAEIINTSADTPSALKTTEDFVFMNKQNHNYLVAYIGNDTEITLPKKFDNKDYEIYNLAFNNYDEITKLNIPNTITKMHWSAFDSCKRLKEINYLGSIDDWCKISFEYGTSNPLCNNANLYINGSLVSNLVIPDITTQINDYAFFGCASIKSIKMHDELTDIGSHAFAHCNALTNVAIEKNTKRLGDNAFFACKNIKTIQFNAINMDDVSHNFVSPCGVFASAGTNTDGIILTIGNQVEKIPALVFSAYNDSPYYYDENGNMGQYESLNIKTVVFEENSMCTEIDWGAFYDVESITEVHYRNTIEDWCKIFFSYTSNPLYLGADLYVNEERVTNLVIPNTITKINDYAFTGCTSITNVTIPDTVTSIGDDSFSACPSLKYNKFDNAYYLGNNENPYLLLVEAINPRITTCETNQNTKFIHSEAFRNCSSLSDLTIPSGILSIGSLAFYECSSLSFNEYYDSYYLGNDENPYLVLVKAGYSDSCSINEATKIIDSSAFEHTYSLDYVIIPNNILFVGDNAFWCSEATIYCEATELPQEWDSDWNSGRPVYWYSETKPTTEGNYWHYVGGVATAWK